MAERHNSAAPHPPIGGGRGSIVLFHTLNDREKIIHGELAVLHEPTLIFGTPRRRTFHTPALPAENKKETEYNRHKKNKLSPTEN